MPIEMEKSYHAGTFFGIGYYWAMLEDVTDLFFTLFVTDMIQVVLKITHFVQMNTFQTLVLQID